MFAFRAAFQFHVHVCRARRGRAFYNRIVLVGPSAFPFAGGVLLKATTEQVCLVVHGDLGVVIVSCGLWVSGRARNCHTCIRIALQ